VRFVIERGNPLDLTEADLKPLAEDLVEISEESGVQITGVPTRRGASRVTLHEVLTVWIPTGIKYAPVAVALIKWARNRIRNEPVRPRHISVYDAEGKLLGAFVIRDGDSEAEDVTAKTTAKRLPPPESE
jgi:hypothetical protein